MFIQLDVGSYSPGQQVNGSILLNLQHNYPDGQQLVLTVTGLEDVQLMEQRSRSVDRYEGGHRKVSIEYYYVQHREASTFFNHKFVVYSFNSPFIPAGQYTFPICFSLQKGLPSSFEHRFQKHGAACHGRVSYALKASVQSLSGREDSRLLCVQRFVVNQELHDSSGVNRQELSQRISSCCCVDKGECRLVTYFEKDDYEPGETAFMVTEVDNSKCQVDVLRIRGLFAQELTLRAQGYTEKISLEHQEMRLLGPKAGRQLIGQQAQRTQVRLVAADGSQVQPTSRGALVSNEYFLRNELEVDACLCCAKRPQCSLNLVVRNPDVIYSQASLPANWQPQIMNIFHVQFTPANLLAIPQSRSNPFDEASTPIMSEHSENELDHSRADIFAKDVHSFDSTRSAATP